MAGEVRGEGVFFGSNVGGCGERLDRTFSAWGCRWLGCRGGTRSLLALRLCIARHDKFAAESRKGRSALRENQLTASSERSMITFPLSPFISNSCKKQSYKGELAHKPHLESWDFPPNYYQLKNMSKNYELEVGVDVAKRELCTCIGNKIKTFS